MDFETHDRVPLKGSNNLDFKKIKLNLKYRLLSHIRNRVYSLKSIIPLRSISKYQILSLLAAGSLFSAKSFICRDLSANIK